MEQLFNVNNGVKELLLGGVKHRHFVDVLQRLHSVLRVDQRVLDGLVQQLFFFALQPGSFEVGRLLTLGLVK